MTITISDDFDLTKIAESGQCFRWQKRENGYIILSGDRILKIHPSHSEICSGCYEVSCSEGEWENFWSDYFDLQTDYARIRSKIDKAKDPYLFSAAQKGKGIRILRQEPWEMLITFIISQRKSIPAIRTCVEKLCMAAGKEIINSPDGETYCAFPGPEETALLSAQQLSDCGLGYRVKYVGTAAEIISTYKAGLDNMAQLDDQDLYHELIGLPGVGKKVANCVMLFGFHRLNGFPEDVWVKRVIQEHYPNGFPLEQYAPYCGVMQQYLFYYRRNCEEYQ